MARQYVMGSYYRIVQTRKPPTKRRNEMNVDQMVEALTWDVRCGTDEEARGDYDHDVEKQRRVDSMKKYRVILVHKTYYEFDVYAETGEAAQAEAIERKDSGNWGKPVEFGLVEIFDMEEVK